MIEPGREPAARRRDRVVAPRSPHPGIDGVTTHERNQLFGETDIDRGGTAPGKTSCSDHTPASR